MGYVFHGFVYGFVIGAFVKVAQVKIKTGYEYYKRAG
jgi:hypothetical protein